MNTSDIMESTKPFFFPGGEQGVLLIHGFLTAPDEMRMLGEYLAAAGMTVIGIRLRGHGTRVEDLENVRWQDWVEDVCEGLFELRRHCARVNIAGLSLGGALTLYTAAHDGAGLDGQHLERIVALSTPDGGLARNPLLRLAKLTAHFIRAIPKVGSDVRDPAARRERFTYRRVPLQGVVQVSELLATLDQALPRVKVPTLLVQSRLDVVVPPHTANRIAAQLGGPSRILWVNRGGHTVVADYERERVFEATRAWLQGEISPA